MSALALNRCEATIRSCAATLLHASYTDGIPTETTDVWRTIAADAARDLTALITRLRAAEARTAWQPIETAPLDEWVAVIDGGVATTGAGSRDGEWWDRRGVRISPTAWTALPAASEAP